MSVTDVVIKAKIKDVFNSRCVLAVALTFHL